MRWHCSRYRMRVTHVDAQVEFAAEIRPHVKKSVLAVTGGFRTAEKSAQAINEGALTTAHTSRDVRSASTLRNL